MKTTSKLHDKENSMADLERNQQTVITFYTRAFNDHQTVDAVAKYVGGSTFNTIRTHPTAPTHLSSPQPVLSPSFRLLMKGLLTHMCKILR
jgi:hypothetical protein